MKASNKKWAMRFIVIAVLILGVTSVSLIPYVFGFGEVSPQAIATEWQAEYPVPRKNFELLGLSVLQIDDSENDYIDCRESLDFQLSGQYTQVITCENSYRIRNANTWSTSEFSGEKVIKLEKLVFLGGAGDLTIATNGNNIESFLLWEPSGAYIDDLFRKPSKSYTVTKGESVLLFPKRRSDGAKILAHGQLHLDVSPIEYTPWIRSTGP